MNKYVLFGLLMAWLLIATYLVNSFEVYLNAGDFVVTGGITAPASLTGGFFAQAGQMWDTFVTLLVFNIEGIPLLITVLFFKVPAFIFIYMLIDIVVNLIPFT